MTEDLKRALAAHRPYAGWYCYDYQVTYPSDKVSMHSFIHLKTDPPKEKFSYERW